VLCWFVALKCTTWPNSGCGLQCLKHRECIGSFTPSNGVDSFDGLFRSASPEQLLLYDYIGSNPAKGGLFRSGPVDNSDGIVQSWLGHVEFLDPTWDSCQSRRWHVRPTDLANSFTCQVTCSKDSTWPNLYIHSSGWISCRWCLQNISERLVHIGAFSFHLWVS